MRVIVVTPHIPQYRIMDMEDIDALFVLPPDGRENTYSGKEAVRLNSMSQM